MQPLEQLVEQAKAWDTDWTTPEGEAQRQLQICNACRYCEGFCAVFPAMTRRLAFPAADIHYLANLCHNCGACLHACQYAPPHDFAVNLPRALAQVRVSTYTEFAWPPKLGQLYARQGLTLALALSAGLALMLALAMALHGQVWGAVPGGFYGVLPHNAMVAVFAPVFLFAVLALGVGVSRFWRGTNACKATPGSAEATGEALKNALSLRYLDGGHGQGCNNDSDAWTLWRRHFHHATFYGFMLCFAATALATVYHYAFGWVAPYGWTSAPKLLGVAGGIGLLVGPAGLWVLNRRRDPAHGDPAQKPMDLGFIALLFLTASSGLALALWRGSPALPLLLCLHLGAVMALFATLPYGKFAHGVYRSAALLKWSIERRQPTKLRLGSE